MREYTAQERAVETANKNAGTTVDDCECECPDGYISDGDGGCKKVCPDEDRKEDANEGFFTENQTIDQEEVAVKKATFSVKTITGLSQTDLNTISQGIENIYKEGSIPMDLEINIDDESSNEGNFKIEFTSLDLHVQEEDGVRFYDYESGFTTTDSDGNITISIARNLNLHNEDGELTKTHVLDNNSIIGTLSHEMGHGLGLKHHWLDFPDKNTEENKNNMMNSRENPDRDLKTTEGEDILPEQKEIIDNKLKEQGRDGSNC